MTWSEKLKARFFEKGHKITVTAILLKAIGIAQRTHPLSRTSVLPWGRRVVLHNIVAGVTVERFIGSEPFVFFGSIDSPDTKAIEEIAGELQAYAAKDIADLPQLALEHRFTNMPWLVRRIILWLALLFPAIRLKYLGATFGLSSLGPLGVKAVTGPCVATSTFGVGAIERRPVVYDGAVEIRPMMTLTLSFDHRVMDGAPAARFLQDVCAFMEGGLEDYV
ncbi:MAG: 2-oxo acid dehydrogenase subunit E2 [Candidatus Melainabacteria bacterium]|nr:2-oxo acid dehydrogenase subunit E2 [Candidatus Melainabacteria bacterium]